MSTGLQVPHGWKASQGGGNLCEDRGAGQFDWGATVWDDEWFNYLVINGGDLHGDSWWWMVIFMVINDEVHDLNDG